MQRICPSARIPPFLRHGAFSTPPEVSPNGQSAPTLWASGRTTEPEPATPRFSSILWTGSVPPRFPISTSTEFDWQQMCLQLAERRFSLCLHFASAGGLSDYLQIDRVNDCRVARRESRASDSRSNRSSLDNAAFDGSNRHGEDECLGRSCRRRVRNSPPVEHQLFKC